MTPITEEQLKAVLPVNVRKNVDSKLLDSINNVIMDSEALEYFRENIIGYAHVMQDGRFKMTSYISAVKYVSFKLLGNTNKEAYVKTFPEKYAKFKATGVPEKDIASYSTAYNKSKLVNLIFAQTMVPTHVLNAPLFQQALNTQAEIMMHSNSDKVRSDAANSLLTHLKPPETAKLEIDIGVKQDRTLDTLRETTMKLVEAQKKLIIDKVQDAKLIAETPLTVVQESDAS